MSDKVTLACPAKVNLSLRVHGRRPDGYHAISTVLQTIDLCDRLTVRRVDRDRPLGLEVPGGGAPDDDSNLVLAAARTFFDAIGEPARGFRFELRKRIPAGSGLGGGSSDAAATLVALQQLRGEPLSPGRLQAVAAAVGSDVPFFLVGGTVLATGRGEKLRALPDVETTPLVVAVPAVEVSTAEVYRRWIDLGEGEFGALHGEGGSGGLHPGGEDVEQPDRGAGASGTGTGKDRESGEDRESCSPTVDSTHEAVLPPAEARAEDDVLPPAEKRAETASWLRGNDLEPVARRLHPEVDRLCRALSAVKRDASDQGPQVSGSGGAVFGIGPWKNAERAVAGLDARLIRTSTLSRDRLTADRAKQTHRSAT